MGPCRVFKYYRNRYRRVNLSENTDKLWVEYSRRWR
jgi:hypothetical protein